MKAVLEGLLFIVGEDGIDLETICNVLEIEKEQGQELIENLENDYKSEDRGIMIKKFGNLYKLTTKKEHKEYYTSQFVSSDFTSSSFSSSAIPITPTSINMPLL